MTQIIYRWNGKYFGFIWQDRLFDKDGNYIAWIDGNEVWKKDGTYLGDLVDGEYVLRATKIVPRTPCDPVCEPSEHPDKPPVCQSREPRSAREDYVDALGEF
jgi:hypothetical protein